MAQYFSEMVWMVVAIKNPALRLELINELTRLAAANGITF